MDLVSSREPDVPDNEDVVLQALNHAIHRYFRKFWMSTILGVASYTLCHPLKVVAVRAIVQFDGKETIYNNIIGAFKEIYNNEGIHGLFAGLAPLLIAFIGESFFYHVITLWLEHTIFYLIPEEFRI